MFLISLDTLAGWEDTRHLLLSQTVELISRKLFSNAIVFPSLSQELSQTQSMITSKYFDRLCFRTAFSEIPDARLRIF